VHTDTVRLALTTSAKPALVLPVYDTSADGAGAGSAGSLGSAGQDAAGRPVGSAEATGPDFRYLVMPARLPG
jgi:hypothetical protein